jgi:hypothetical protein
MDIQIAALCDAANDYGGKLCVLGAFDSLLTAQFPALHPQCAIALRIVFEKMEEGAHKLRIALVDDDGHAVMPSIELPIKVAVPADATFLSQNIIVSIQQLKFERPGTYSIDLAIDGRHEKSIPLSVRLFVPPQPPTP